MGEPVPPGGSARRSRQQIGLVSGMLEHIRHELPWYQVTSSFVREDADVNQLHELGEAHQPVHDLDDETRETAVSVLRNAVAWFARGVAVERLLSDTGSRLTNVPVSTGHYVRYGRQIGRSARCAMRWAGC